MMLFSNSIMNKCMIIVLCLNILLAYCVLVFIHYFFLIVIRLSQLNIFINFRFCSLVFSGFSSSSPSMDFFNIVIASLPKEIKNRNARFHVTN